MQTFAGRFARSFMSAQPAAMPRSVAHAALGRGDIGVRHGDAEARELRARWLFRRLEVRNAVERIVHALDGVAQPRSTHRARARRPPRARTPHSPRRSSRAIASPRRSRGGKASAPKPDFGPRPTSRSRSAGPRRTPTIGKVSPFLPAKSPRFRSSAKSPRRSRGRAAGRSPTSPRSREFRRSHRRSAGEPRRP